MKHRPHDGGTTHPGRTASETWASSAPTPVFHREQTTGSRAGSTHKRGTPPLPWAGGPSWGPWLSARYTTVRSLPVLTNAEISR
ncbi:hypothetical protein [Streptomyces sp. NPDC088812]|uniref:hypothetical protein n=1 Tax=Streptomyces sp. NPDC088812 TaxID=3365905 RepID=UPI0037F23A2C